MKTISNLPRWLWGSVVGIGLVALSIALFYLYKPNSSIAPSNQEVKYSVEIDSDNADSQPIDAEPHVVIKMVSTPTSSFQSASVEEACRIHEYPYYWDYRDNADDTEKKDPLIRSLTFKECRDALEPHVGAMNPYLWGLSLSHRRQISLVVLENPITFDRIFANPSEDFARVKDALSRPECLLENGTAANFELNESCNAEALLNYALFNRYCYFGGVKMRPRLIFEDASPKESRFMWQRALEGEWVNMKCKEFDPELKLSKERYPELTKLLSSLEKGNPDSSILRLIRQRRSELPEPKRSELPETLSTFYLTSVLIDLAARLGDDAAALTSNETFGESGIDKGRFKELFSNPAWEELRWKKEPSQERFLETFQFLSTLTTADIKVDWDWLVHHLCTQPFYEPVVPLDRRIKEASTGSLTCRAVINSLYTDGDLSDSVLEVIEKFENTALELDLYD